MWLCLLKGKIHRARVTAADLHYMGSITVDQELMEAAGILPYERVQVVNINNGSRLETYALPGSPGGGGEVVLNGAAARWFSPGDLVIIMAYGFYTPEEARTHRPLVVLVDEKNRIREIREG